MKEKTQEQLEAALLAEQEAELVIERLAGALTAEQQAVMRLSLESEQGPRTVTPSEKRGWSEGRTKGLRVSPLAGPKLQPGEVSARVSCRMGAEPAQWWSNLTPAQRGAIATHAWLLSQQG